MISMNISKSYVIPEAIKLKKIRNEDHRHFVVIPRRALLNRNITGENLRVLGVLASYCNKSGYNCFFIVRWNSHDQILSCP